MKTKQYAIKWWKHRLSYQGRTVDALALEAENVTNDDMLWVVSKR